MWMASNSANNEKKNMWFCFHCVTGDGQGQNVQEKGLKHGGEEVCEHRVCPQSAGCVEQ